MAVSPADSVMLKVCAGVEAVAPQLRHGIRQRDFFQSAAIESTLTDADQSLRKLDTPQRRGVLEGRSADVGQALRQRNLRYAETAVEGVITDPGNALGHLDPVDLAGIVIPGNRLGGIVPHLTGAGDGQNAVDQLPIHLITADTADHFRLRGLGFGGFRLGRLRLGRFRLSRFRRLRGRGLIEGHIGNSVLLAVFPDVAVPPAVDRQLVGPLEGIAAPDLFHRSGDHKRFQLCGVPECLGADLRHTLWNGQLPDAAAPEHTGGDLLQITRQLHPLQGGAVLEGIDQSAGGGIRKCNLLELLAVLKSIIMDKRDLLREPESLQSAVPEQAVGDIHHLRRQLDFGQGGAVRETLIQNEPDRIRENDLLQVFTPAESVFSQGVHALRQLDPLNAAAAEHMHGGVFHIRRQPYLPQRLRLTQTVIQHLADRIREDDPLQIHAASKGLLADDDHAIRHLHAHQTRVHEASLGDLPNAPGQLDPGQSAAPVEAVHPKGLDPVMQLHLRQLVAILEQICRQICDPLGNGDPDQAGAVHRPVPQLRQGIGQLQRRQLFAALEGRCTDAPQTGAAFHTGELTAGQKRLVADLFQGRRQHDAFQIQMISKQSVAQAGDPLLHNDLLHRTPLGIPGRIGASFIVTGITGAGKSQHTVFQRPAHSFAAASRGGVGRHRHQRQDHAQRNGPAQYSFHRISSFTVF